MECTDVAERFGPFHVAAIPIGGYLPRAFHLTPEDAVVAFKDLNPLVAVPIHWGTFTITSEPYLEPLSRLDDALRHHGIARDRFPILAHGQSIGAH